MIRARIRVWAVALCLSHWGGIAGAEPASEAGEAGKATSWYAASIARSDGSFLLTHYWSKGSRLRAETVAGGRRLITLVDETTYYVIDPTTADAIAIERSPLSIAGDATRGRPFADELGALLRGGGEQVGEEELSGQQVDRYQLTNEAGRIQVWVRRDLGLPVRVERYIRSSAAREQIDYLNWIRNPPLADSFFEPPSDFEIQQIGYEDYVKRSMAERLGPAPPFYAHLLHGEPEN
jgi:outer membrane lipoprotein-sorting protein